VSAVVSDSSPLNYLALLSDFDLLRQLYRTVVIPRAVYREVVESGADYPVANAVRLRSAIGSQSLKLPVLRK
jgi:predicted nucleic acid-binding protein